jgi:hypothetical protein
MTPVRVAVGMASGGLGVTACLLGHGVAHEWASVRGPGPAAFDEALVLVAGIAGLLVEAWLVLSTLAALLAYVPGRCGRLAQGLAQAWAPAMSRRLAAAVLGVAAVGTVAPAAALAVGPPSPPALSGARAPGEATILPGPGFTLSTSAAPQADGPSPGWTPSRPVVRPQVSPALLSTSPPAAGSDRVVVHRGDTLWDIVRRRLGPHASDAEVARVWPHWHAANLTVIGPDPDVLLPGQILRAPDPASELRRHDVGGAHR